MTADELRAILDEVRHLKRYDDSDPMNIMCDTIYAHRDALVELVAASERIVDARCDDRACHDGWHWNGCPKNDATRDFTAALAKVHAVGKEGRVRRRGRKSAWTTCSRRRGRMTTRDG